MQSSVKVIVMQFWKDPACTICEEEEPGNVNKFLSNLKMHKLSHAQCLPHLTGFDLWYDVKELIAFIIWMAYPHKA